MTPITFDGNRRAGGLGDEPSGGNDLTAAIEACTGEVKYLSPENNASFSVINYVLFELFYGAGLRDDFCPEALRMRGVFSIESVSVR